MSYARDRYVPAPSCPSQTAWAMLGLVAAGDRESTLGARGSAILIGTTTSRWPVARRGYHGHRIPERLLSDVRDVSGLLPAAGVGPIPGVREAKPSFARELLPAIPAVLVFLWIAAAVSQSEVLPLDTNVRAVSSFVDIRLAYRCDEVCYRPGEQLVHLAALRVAVRVAGTRRTTAGGDLVSCGSGRCEFVVCHGQTGAAPAAPGTFFRLRETRHVQLSERTRIYVALFLPDFGESADQSEMEIGTPSSSVVLRNPSCFRNRILPCIPGVSLPH